MKAVVFDKPKKYLVWEFYENYRPKWNTVWATGITSKGELVALYRKGDEETEPTLDEFLWGDRSTDDCYREYSEENKLTIPTDKDRH
jgi:hypothetical protein